jgi:DNA-directed RNA polymerase specialized sigma24 family protein
MSCSISPSWETLLIAYLSGAGDLAGIYQTAKGPLTRIVARLAPWFSHEDQEDAVQQVFLRLLENPPKYEAGKCSVRTLTYGLIRNAIRQVRAMFASPGERTRFESAEQQEITAANYQKIPYPEPEQIQEPEELESNRWTATDIHSSAEAHEVLSQMPADVAAAAWLVHGREHSIVEAAVMMKKSRFAVARLLGRTRRAVLGAHLPPPASAEHHLSFVDRPVA